MSQSVKFKTMKELDLKVGNKYFFTGKVSPGNNLLSCYGMVTGTEKTGDDTMIYLGDAIFINTSMKIRKVGCVLHRGSVNHFIKHSYLLDIKPTLLKEPLFHDLMNKPEHEVLNILKRDDNPCDINKPGIILYQGR